MAEGIRNLIQTGACDLRKQEVNKVIYENQEIRMKNIRNRTTSKTREDKR